MAAGNAGESNVCCLKDLQHCLRTRSGQLLFFCRANDVSYFCIQWCFRLLLPTCLCVTERDTNVTA